MKNLNGNSNSKLISPSREAAINFNLKEGKKVAGGSGAAESFCGIEMDLNSTAIFITNRGERGKFKLN
jgi:hypothetical protein